MKIFSLSCEICVPFIDLRGSEALLVGRGQNITVALLLPLA